MNTMIKKSLAAAALLLAVASAQAVTANCIPSDFGGTGSAMVSNKNAIGRWAGWWCPGEAGPTVYACRKASCPSGAAIASKLARMWDYTTAATFNEQVYSLPSADTVKDVWLPDIAKLNAVKPK